MLILLTGDAEDFDGSAEPVSGTSKRKASTTAAAASTRPAKARKVSAKASAADASTMSNGSQDEIEALRAENERVRSSHSSRNFMLSIIAVNDRVEGSQRQLYCVERPPAH